LALNQRLCIRDHNNISQSFSLRHKATSINPYLGAELATDKIQLKRTALGSRALADVGLDQSFYWP